MRNFDFENGPEFADNFSAAPTWYKFNSYCLREYSGGKYIMPAPGAGIITYRPLENANQMLEDFLHILKTETQAALLEFINKYGHFGLFFDAVELDTPLYGSKNYRSIFVKPTGHGYRPQNKVAGFKNYDEYASRFFPHLEPPLPYIYAPKEQNKFFSNYGETVTDILNCAKFLRLKDHLKDWETFYAGNFSEENHYTETGMPWHQRLSLPIENVSVRSRYINGNWSLEWQFSSLIEAIYIAYVLNFTGKIGRRSLKPCGNETCNNFHQNKGVYCSESCGHAQRNRRSRRNKKRREEVKE